MQKEITTLTEAQFEDNFILQKNHLDDNASFDGYLYETFSEEMEYVLEMVKENRVITVIEYDTDDESEDSEMNLYYVTGYHIVNRLGFLILDKPYEFDFEVKIIW
jgi:hypothetical protein